MLQNQYIHTVLYVQTSVLLQRIYSIYGISSLAKVWILCFVILYSNACLFLFLFSGDIVGISAGKIKTTDKKVPAIKYELLFSSLSRAGHDAPPQI